MDRKTSLNRATSKPTPWDVVVIGGGATGLGTASAAASRGYRTLLLEQSDFAKGTSSRSTKLSHGGVRYLQQGNLPLVIEALKERGRMLRNAPHLVRRQAFLIPAYATWQIPFYGIGLKTYDLLSGPTTFGRSRMMGAEAIHQLLPTVSQQLGHHKLSGGVLYYDGQFDDARYCIALAQTLDTLGGVALNYTRVTRLLKRNGIAAGRDARSTAAPYCLAPAQTLDTLGGVALNYTRVTRLLKRNGIVAGVVARDEESRNEFDVPGN